MKNLDYAFVFLWTGILEIEVTLSSGIYLYGK